MFVFDRMRSCCHARGSLGGSTPVMCFSAHDVFQFRSPARCRVMRALHRYSRCVANASPQGDQRRGFGVLATRLLGRAASGLMRVRWLVSMPATVRATAFTSSGSSKIISTVA